MGVLVSQGQAATTYAPAAALEFGTTYYWRIDEVNAPPDSTIFKGEVWSFTTGNFIIVDDFVRAKKNLLEAKTSALLAEAEWMYARGEMLSYDR